MNKFTLQCESILKELMLEAHAIISYVVKNQMIKDIQASNALYGSDKLEALKEVKRNLATELLKINYMNINSVVKKDSEGNITITDSQKYQNILEFAIEKLGEYNNIFRRLSKFHLAESSEITDASESTEVL